MLGGIEQMFSKMDLKLKNIKADITIELGRVILFKVVCLEQLVK